MTRQCANSSGVAEKSAADAPEHEIEVTPAMIEAGALALLWQIVLASMVFRIPESRFA
jgi:hypothetical protein